MEKDSDLYLSFKVVFNNQAIIIYYDTSFEEFKTQTVESLIKEVLNKIGPKPLKKEPKDFILYCPCGNQIKQNELLCKSKCDHSIKEDFDKGKKRDDNYFLCEKLEIENKKEEELTNDEINSILKKALERKKPKKGPKPQNKKTLTITESLKNKIKQYKIKEERGKRIIEKQCSLYYKEEYYKELLEMGIEKNKAKAALRFANNDKEEAALIGTDEEFYWDNKDCLLYDNNDVLSKEKFDSLVFNEIKKEYPFLDNEEIKNKLDIIINLAVKKEIIDEDDNEIIDEDYNEIIDEEEEDNEF